jgi:hypothetical protein
LLFFLLGEKKPRERLILRGDSSTDSGIHSGYREELPALRIFTDFSPPNLGLGFFGDGWRHVLSKE